MNSAPVLFRCDASPRIGHGHWVRCLSLAQALLAKGITSGFVTHKVAPEMSPDLRPNSFQFYRIPDDETILGRGDPLPDSDLAFLLKTIQQTAARAVLVDHYGATPRYLDRVHAQSPSLGVIDDGEGRDLVSADWLLNPNIGSEHFRLKTHDRCVRLLGVRYPLLRPEFAEARRRLKRTFHSSDHRLLVTLGGGDTASQLLSVLEAVERVPTPLEIRCMGRGPHKAIEAIRNFIVHSHHHIQFSENSDAIWEDMSWADLAVTGGGGSCWELMCLGTPFIVCKMSEDQARNVEFLAHEDWADCLDLKRLEELPSIILNAYQNVEIRQIRSQRGMAFVDGLGAERAAGSLQSLFSSQSVSIPKERKA